MGPFLAAVAAFATSAGGFLVPFLGFVLFAATMGALMLVVSLLVGTSQATLLRGLRRSTRRVQRFSSALLIAVGIALIYFTADSGAFQDIFLP